jgi:hypothetical protein
LTTTAAETTTTLTTTAAETTTTLTTTAAETTTTGTVTKTYYAFFSNLLEIESISTTKIDPNSVFGSLTSTVNLLFI